MKNVAGDLGQIGSYRGITVRKPLVALQFRKLQMTHRELQMTHRELQMTHRELQMTHRERAGIAEVILQGRTI